MFEAVGFTTYAHWMELRTTLRTPLQVTIHDHTNAWVRLTFSPIRPKLAPVLQEAKVYEGCARAQLVQDVAKTAEVCHRFLRLLQGT